MAADTTSGRPSLTIAAADGSWTALAWVKPGTVSANAEVFRTISGATADQFLRFESGNILQASQEGAANAVTTTTTTCAAGAWACVAVVYDSVAGTSDIYTGSLTVAMATATYSGQTGPPTTPVTGGTTLVVGASTTGGSEPFLGPMASFVLLNRTLTLVELERFRLGWLPLDRAGDVLALLPLWSPNVATTISDYSPHRAAVTVNGTVAYADGPSLAVHF